MSKVYRSIIDAYKNSTKCLAVLLDPDKVDFNGDLEQLISSQIVDYVFIGGSSVKENDTDALAKFIKTKVKKPVILFPGDLNQLTEAADAVLFLSLVSGRNPDYLIGKHVDSIPILETMNVEVIATAYILVDGGVETSTQRETQTKPMTLSDTDKIINTAKAAELLGFKCIYLEAGSGAKIPIPQALIKGVKSKVDLPLIVGGGIKSKQQIEMAYNSGADIVVVGNILETNPELINTFN